MTLLLVLFGSMSGQDAAEGEWICHQIGLQIYHRNSVSLLAQRRFKTVCHPVSVRLSRDF